MFALALAALYLLPFTYEGERVLLLLFSTGFWAAALALTWRHKPLRLITLALAALQLFPIRSGLTRTAILASVLLLYIGLIVLNRSNCTAIAGLAVAPVLIGLAILLPGRRVDPAEMRREYVRSLLPYRGAVYIWGGENRLGIDCSGLVRCGWIDANLRIGLRTANPDPLRTAVQTWLQDCSAEELGAGYRGRTMSVTSTRSLNGLDYGLLKPGDIAVSESGKHTLAYIGSASWIEAEPIFNGVKIARVPVHSDIWFDSPMRIVRWQELNDSGASAISTPESRLSPKAPR